jgi:transposase
MMIFVGDDWSEGHHDLWLVDDEGLRLGSVRLVEGVDGLARFHELVGGFVDDPGEVLVGVETDRGLWVGALVAAGYRVFAINPKSMSRYRDRYRLSGAKSDQSDAMVLADVVRTDRHHHREVAGDTDEVEAIKVLARVHQSLVWERTRTCHRLRSTLREFYPQALAVFPELAHRDALAVLAKAPTPVQGAALSISQIKAVLKKAGRQRNLDVTAERIRDGLRTSGLAAPAPVTAAMGAVCESLVRLIAAHQTEIERLESVLADHFEQHPDAHIYLSLPGAAVVLGARMLGEFGDDPNRFTDAKSRRNYAATSPITVASGKSRQVKARYVKNHRLNDAAIRWAFCSINVDPECRAFYNEQRTKNHGHYTALRGLANRLVGILDGCLKTNTEYNPETAWSHRRNEGASQAA